MSIDGLQIKAIERNLSKMQKTTMSQKLSGNEYGFHSLPPTVVSSIFGIERIFSHKGKKLTELRELSTLRHRNTACKSVLGSDAETLILTI